MRAAVPGAAEDRSGKKAGVALEALRAAGTVDPGARVHDLTQLEGGWSRHSYVICLSVGEKADRKYVIRVKPPGAILDSDIGLEFRTYRVLAETDVLAPNAHVLEEDGDNAFEGPFLIMDFAEGRAPNVWRERERTPLESNWRAGGSLASDLAHNLARIHAIGPESLAGTLPSRDFEQAVCHWRRIHDRMALIRDPVIEEAYAWLLSHPPNPVPPSLVHGDYRIGNCLVHDARITAVLDWELAYSGDHRFDLGYLSLEYNAGRFVRPGSSLLNAVAEREWFFDEYERLSGRPVDREVVRVFAVLGALALIAILTTGVRMYAEGRTRDIRMVWSRFAMPVLRQELTELMEW